MLNTPKKQRQMRLHDAPKVLTVTKSNLNRKRAVICPLAFSTDLFVPPNIALNGHVVIRPKTNK